MTHRAAARWVGGAAITSASMAAAVLVLAACSSASGGAPAAAHMAGSTTTSSSPSVTSATSATASSSSPSPSRSRHVFAVTTSAPKATLADRAGVPETVEIPAIGVTSSLQPLHLLPDGELQSPSEWQRAGWFADGVEPGQVGPAVIAGHIDSTGGPAIFYRLRDLHAGDPVEITTSRGVHLTFVVDSQQAFPKSHFPTQAVYGTTPDRELRLITCTGTFDAAHHNYLDNLVVFAHLTSARQG